MIATEDHDRFPIPYHPTWEILDATKLKCFCCRRKFFFEYILGWRPTYPNNHFVFGDGIHAAFDHLYTTDFSTENILLAYNKFEEVYRKDFDPSTDELFKGKTPDAVLEMLPKYVVEYGADRHNYKVLYTEISGSVPISMTPERRLSFRLDLIKEDLKDGKILADEHKTTGLYFSDIWADQWELDIQIGIYTHALYCLYPMEKVRGVMVNGISFRKLKDGYACDFKRVPCWKDKKHMEYWIWEINNLWDEVAFEYDRLKSCTVDDPVLQCFPRDPSHCTAYYQKCAYHDICVTWRNPLRHCDEPPMGFEVSFWDPREKDSRHQVDLKFGGSE
jgi:hypothetical protein